ncbi:GNAT family N-acetyltransferase [Micromonospora sp. NPDC051006]|uniref:GNAT family N-acetyltransferase n=1 Tax=Micromonospora sp. NPDC051006 TaxID=3364283 RepID=UPI003799668B
MRPTRPRSATPGPGPSSASGTSLTWSSRCCRADSGFAPPTRPGRRPLSRPIWTPGLPRRGLPGRPAGGGVPRRPAHPGGGAGRDDGVLDDHVARRSEQDRRVRAGRYAPDYRRRGLGRAMLLHGMRLARAAGATHVTVACLGAPGHPQARGLYYSVGFREFTRDAPLLAAGTAG